MKKLFLLFIVLLTVIKTFAQIKIDTANYDHIIRVACIGASTTYGGNIENREVNSYPAQLGRMLGNKWNVQNFGADGAGILKKGSTPYWNTEAFKLAQTFLPDVVIFNIGVNDTQPQNWQYKTDFFTDYTELINIFQNLPSHPKIYLCIEVPVFQDRWGIRAFVVNKELDPMKKKLAHRKKLPMIDLYTPLKNRSDLFADGVHPNAEGAGIMAAAVFNVLTGKAD